MQKTIIIGHLGQDAQMRESNGRQFITFSVADSNKRKNADGTTTDNTQWIECLYSSTGVFPYLKKGTQVAIAGRLYAQAYEKNGQAMASLKCQVQELNLLGGGNSGNNNQQAQAYQPQSNSMNDSNDDLPF